MKRTGKCPKCDNSEIIIVPGDTGVYGVGNNIPTSLYVLNYVKVPRYVCCSCGYVEEWIETEDILKVKKKYGKK